MTQTISSADDWGSSVCVPGTGAGTLAALGNVVLLVGSTDPTAVGPLLGQAQQVAAAGGQGRQLVRSFAGLLATLDPSEVVPDFVALAPHTTGLAVLVQGEARVHINGEEISGAESLAWVERLVAWPVTDVVARVDAGSDTGGGLFRLAEGVVPAGGFAIATGIDGDLVDLVEGSAVAPDAVSATSMLADQMDAEPETPAEPAPAPASAPVQPVQPEQPAAPVAAAPPAGAERPLPPALPDQQASFDSVVLGSMDEEEPPAPLPIVQAAAPAPAATPAAPAATSADGEEVVRGVYCKNRHFNDPRQLFCAVCGINMVQQTPVLVNGARPPLGTVVLDDGTIFQLDRPYLIGRDPASDERVRSGAVRGVPVVDSSNQISRVHARLEMRGWDVVLVDNASTNGTFVNPPHTAGWQRLPSGGEHVLAQGTKVRIGTRTLVFNTHGGAAA